MFVTPAGIEVPAVTTAQMREVDRIAIEDTGPNLFQMMENAGRNLAGLALEQLGDRWQTATVVVLAGTGGNGGGGICAARHLANHGVAVKLCLAEPAGLGQVPAFQYKVFQSTDGIELPRDRIADVRADLILDALVGYSLGGAPRGAVAELVGWANGSGAPIVSLDVPSGIDATTGEAPGIAIAPRATLTLALPKLGLASRGGELVLADIGIPVAVYRRLSLRYLPPFGDRYRVTLRRSA